MPAARERAVIEPPEEVRAEIATVRFRRRDRTQSRRHERLLAALPALAAKVTADHDLVVYQIVEPPDDFGRTMFIRHWWDGQQHRAQAYVADLAIHRQRDTDAGKHTEDVDRGPARDE